MAKAKGLTRKITRKQARSYEASHPNARGVTHLVELNGEGAYERRYAETKEFFENSEKSMAGYTAKQQRAMKKMSPARRAAFKKMLDRAPTIDKVRRARKARKAKASRRAKPAARRARPASRRATPNKTQRVRKGKRSTKRTTKKTRAQALARARRTPAARKAAAKRPPKEGFIRAQLAKGRSKKQAEAAWKLAHGRRLGAGKKRGRQTRTYGKKYKALRARMGPKSRWTYKYRTKKGRVRDIPDHALLGYPSAAALRRAEKHGSEAERRRIARKAAKLYAQRERGAQRQYRRTMAGKGVFVPNAGDEILSFEEWKEMRPNATRKQIAAARRNIKKAQAARRRKARGSKKTTRKRTTKRKTTTRKVTRRKTSKAKRSAAAKKGWRKRKARRKSGTTKRRAKRKTTKRRTKRRGKKRVSMATRRRISAALKRYHKTCRGGKKPTRRKRRKTTRRRKPKARWTTARKNQGSYAVNRRRYRRNVGGAEYMTELKNALKLGALVTVGYVAHRALSKVLSEQVLGKIDAFATGTLGKYRGLISSVLTAMIGVPVTVRVAPKQAVPVAAGMAASLIHGAIIEALSMAGQTGAASYLSNYPNAEGSAYGSYYTLPGMGSYYTFSPHEVYSGFGQSPQLTQAAAGYGMTDAQLRQAAAGYGQSPMLTQAAAGMGQAQLTQAAAGVGEYVAYGANGIGEYDEVPTFAQPMSVDEGIHPNLHSAEQALSVAEAAAGVGSSEIPLQSTVNPTVIADPISDLPGGSRAGVFQGGDGIFG